MKYTTFELADAYINNTGASVFLTGKAGTGKTTFLRHICQNTKKRCIVVAPTGVAAINAGGVTIHSFFQLPFSPYLPTVSNALSEYSLSQDKRRLRKEKINIIRTLDLLIIDEISMVRADLLDAIDDTLRRYRRSSKAFGGVQLLMIGDLQQLPPIVKDDEWLLMRQVYPSPFFFNSKALQQVNFITIELKTVFRQSDSVFIELLNNIRQNKFDKETLDTLNTRYQPNFIPKDEEGYIQLTTHNSQAQSVNSQKLDTLQGDTHTFNAQVEGNFPEYSYPTDYSLTLKEGAQVMFVRNDSSPEKRFYNGKIGSITQINDNNIEVTDEKQNRIIVEKETWENYKYIINKETKEIEQEVDGKFVQFPLKLAWAITVHKSQGLTFEKAIIDVGSAFTFGQVYVALSRCKSFDGLVLSSKITPQCAFANNDIDTFNNQIPSESEVENKLQQAENEFYFENLNEIFDFSFLQKSIDKLNNIFHSSLSTIYPNETEQLRKDITNNLETNVYSVAERFSIQLYKIRTQCNNNPNNDVLKERIKKASSYFLSQIESSRNSILPLLSLDIDNKEIRKQYTDASENVIDTLELKLIVLPLCKDGFSINEYIKTKNNYLLKDKNEKKKTEKNQSSQNNTPYDEIINILKEWRKEKCYELDVPAFYIMHQNTLMEIAKKMPATEKELLDISGFGKKKYENYGVEILDILNTYYLDKNIDRETGESLPLIDYQPPKRSTHEITLEFFKEGKTIEEIAKERNLAISTIEGHIIKAVSTGDIDIQSVINSDTLEILIPFFTENKEILLKEAFEHFQEKYSYAHLRMVKNHCNNTQKEE